MRWLLALLLTACSTPAAPAPVPPVASPPVRVPVPVPVPALVLTLPPEPPPPPAPNALADALDSLFATAAAKDSFSGSVIVIDGGKEVLAKGYGFADRAAKRANTPETIFRIGSVSKQFAATAVLALVADGKLRITDPLSKFFPDYPKRNLTRDGVEVTLHHLLSHTSGLPDPRATDTFSKLAWRRTIDPYEQMAWVSTVPLVRKPGTAFQYLNYNFLLAALIVEKTTGQRYEDFLKQRFFVPLGMTDTGTILPAASEPRAAAGYEKRDGAFANFAESPFFKDPDVSFSFGSGQIYSTVRDLAKWDRALNGEAVLPAAKRELLFTPNLGDYGYGWVVQKKGGVSFEWHNGALSRVGFTAYAIRVPSKDRFVAYLSNFELPIIEPFEAKVDALVLK